MQDILLPLLVLNLLLTFWLLRQHILRQGIRHRRREALAEWQSHVGGRNKQFFEMLVNQSEMLNELKLEMAAITKDHYALNERLDGISVYDIKAILAGQERIQMLESKMDAISVSHAQKIEEVNNFNSRLSSLEFDIEAIKDFINSYEARLSYLESTISQQQAQGHPVWDSFVLSSAVGDLRKDFLRLEGDLTVISQSNLSVNDRTLKLESSITSIETTFDDFGRRFNDLWALRNSHEMLSATVETLRIQHSGLAQDTSQALSEVDNRLNSHSRQIDTVSYWLCENTKFPEKIEPFNPDTLIDSLEINKAANQSYFLKNFWTIAGAKDSRATILLSDDDIIQEGDERYFGPNFKWEGAVSNAIGKTVSEFSESIGYPVLFRRTITPDGDQSPESDRQEDKAYDQLLDKAVKNARPKKQKPGTDYTHDIIP